MWVHTTGGCFMTFKLKKNHIKISYFIQNFVFFIQKKQNCAIKNSKINNKNLIKHPSVDQSNSYELQQTKSKSEFI